MGDALDQDMLGVESAGDGELQVGPGFPASSPAVGKLRICDAAANQEATVKEHTMGHLLPFAYPEMLKASFPEMFKKMSMATVQVNLRRVNKKPMDSVYGKIAALIRDEHKHSVSFQVGSMLFRERTWQNVGSSETRLDLARSVVVVPSGWVLHIEVDLYIKTGNKSKVNNLKAILDFSNMEHCIDQARSDEFEVEVTASWCPKVRNEDIGKQLSAPVEVKMVSEEYLSVVYTIGDELSFTEFILTLRRILADHPDREDILDEHPDFLNLSSTRQHPVLAKQRAGQPARWLHIKLQVEGNEAARWTTLIMRDDNLYVCGFMNQHGVYGLVDTDEKSKLMLPKKYCDMDVQRLKWTVQYKSILGAGSQKEVINKLDCAHLGKTFADDAVHKLSCYSGANGEEDCARRALAGLIVMVCESARLNHLHDSIVAGWSNGTGFTKELMRNCVWGYGKKSEELRMWKSGGYAQTPQLPHPIEELQAIYLVLNTRPPKDKNQLQAEKNNQHGEPSNAGNDGDSTNKPGGTSRGGGHPSDGGHASEQRGGCNDAGRGDSSRKRDNNSGSNGKACIDGSGGSPASKSEEASDAGSGGGRDSKSGEAIDADNSCGPTSSSGGSARSASQPGEAGDSSASQPWEADDAGLGRGNSGSGGQPGEPDDDQLSHGRPRVELLAIRADLQVKGTEIAVFDGRRGQIIYRKEEIGQEDQGMVDLVLTGPYKGISAYGCFAISIDIPAAAGSWSGDAGGNLEWEWDCYDPKYAAQIDEPPVRHTIHTRDGCREVAEITYAVMSNALEATVEVLLRLQDGQSPCGVYGVITAYIGDFPDGSDLFRRTQRTSQLCSPTLNNDGWWCLELARNLVAVPCGKLLRIKVDLQLESSNIRLNGTRKFNNGVSTAPSLNVDGNEVKVNTTWYPEIARPSHPPEQITIKEAEEEKSITAPSSEQIISDTLEVKMVSGHLTVVYTIGNATSFTEFIMALRAILADHPDREDIFDRHNSSILSSTKVHPVLAKQRAEQPARWIHVKLQAVKGEEMLSTTTLIMRDDNLYVCGFVNEQGDSFVLIDNLDRSADILPVDGYSPKRLSWGVGYRSLLDADTEDDLVRRLRHTRIGRDFAMKAVHVLSCFPAWEDARREYRWNMIPHKQMNPRLALAGLIIMVCESARMNRINDLIERCWSNNDMKLTNDLMRDCVLNYGRMSCELLTWKSKGYTTNPDSISWKHDIYLVLNSPRLRFMHRGRPRVELLAMRADLGVVDTTIMVFDGKRGHIIYTKEEHEEQGMIDLVLTGPCTSISAYGRFAIKIDIPAGTAAGSSKGNAGGSIKWEWDCYDPKYAQEVGKHPVTRTISSLGPGRNVEVTYAVMSNALEATVQVKMRTTDGNSPCSVHGIITARVGDFEDQIILFKRTQGTAHHFSPTHSTVLQVPRPLKLARNVVAVPCFQLLHIEMHLNIENCKNPGVSNNTRFDGTLSFGNGTWSQRRKVDDVDEVEVNVAWYPDLFSDSSGRSRSMEIKMSRRQPDLSYTVGDDAKGFSTFITELRRLVVEHPHCKDLLADHPQLSSTHNHPVLPRERVTRDKNMSQAHMNPEMLFHIKLKVVDRGVETSSITLVMRDDNLDVIGFVSKYGHCYELRGDDKAELPSEYRSESLRWRQGGILLEDSTRLGKTFAADAVHVLSRFVNVAHPKYRQALLVLMVIIRDSARIEPIRDAIAGGWKNGMELTKQLKDYRRNWQEISSALLDWRDHAYQGWPQNTELESIGIKSPEDALKVVPLVFNDENRI